ncbi:hypothetical protein J8F10_24445 [Gemmata sp. G18]|uniref:Uncharacterized protein n=1 Tax=Gemmata palustris TaxID=2822762 RepID=A0ABS5BXE2_9BACT|nr:hypothetical protein [Gemmata palustris]MBP3958412.1 hypothetical protein [Gemmata palustris]
MHQRNREVEGYSWQIYHGPSSSWLVVVAFCSANSMDGALFINGTSTLLEEASMMDNKIRRLGLL